VYLIPVWGLVQIAAHTTSSQADTREGLLRWAAYAGVFFLGQVIGRGRQARRNLLTVLLVFSTAMAALCLMQMFSSEGKVLWYFPTDFSVVFATYVNYDAYAMLIELALPIALWRGVTEGWRSWQYPLAAGLMYASVIGSASRMGTALCTVELLGLLAIGLVRMRDPETGLPTRSTASILLVIPVIAIAFTLTVGWQHVVQRFHDSDPYQVRREFLAAAVDMAKQRPAMGYGLGTFPEVYQRYAIRDFPFYANHAHNDWAEFAADGGIPFLLLVLIPFAAAIPAALRHAWGIGLIAIMAHACVDFPYPRVSVAGWLFLMLGLLYSARDQEAKE